MSNKVCLHCGGNPDIGYIPLANLYRYGEPRLVRAVCCGKGVHIHREPGYVITPYYTTDDERKTDDWGASLNKSLRKERS